MAQNARCQGLAGAAAGTWSALTAAWRANNTNRLRPASVKLFNYCLNRVDQAAGDQLVAAMTKDIYQMLDGMSATPHAANSMLSVLRAVLEWGVQRGYRDDNPAVGIKPLPVDEGGHEPWSAEGYAFVIAHAPTHLQRMAYLGRSTGQRASDLVRMRPTDLAPDGITLRIGKLRERKHFVPLTTEQMAAIKSWDVRDLDFFITTPVTGKRCTAHYLNQLWNEWRGSPEAAPVRDLKLTIQACARARSRTCAARERQTGQSRMKSVFRRQWCGAISALRTSRLPLGQAAIDANRK